jgi:hypothetical protein
LNIIFLLNFTSGCVQSNSGLNYAHTNCILFKVQSNHRILFFVGVVGTHVFFFSPALNTALFPMSDKCN